jgi:hypothetical protein
MRKIFYIFAVLSFFATAICYGQVDSCLKLLGPTFIQEPTWENPDSIMVDSCVSSPTYGQKYARGWFHLRFTYHILPTPVGPKDTIIDRTWKDIDTQYISVRNAFDTLEQRYGSFFFRKFQPHWNDTANGGDNFFDVWFNDNVNIDSVEIAIGRVPLVVYCDYVNRAGILVLSASNHEQKYSGLYFSPNPTNNHFTLLSSDKTISGRVSVRIFDQRGGMVASESVDISSENKINVSSLASGVYQVYCDDAKVGSLVIQR